MKDEIFADEVDDEDIKDRRKREFQSVMNKKGDEFSDNLVELVMVDDYLDEIQRSDG